MSNNFSNIAGGPFLPYVAKQIETRKKYISKYSKNETSTTNHILYQNNRNAWIRLTSSTDISEEHIIGRKYNIWGDELAKKYILQGGSVSRNENNSFQNRSGVGNGKLYGNTSDSQGLRPLPGITSIDISSAGKLGTLQYANVNFVCYDLEQLEIFDALYMKLGFSMILEWGHTTYLDNNNTDILFSPNPMNLFDSFTSKEEIVSEIQKKKIQHSGNYDAMLGTVSNFGWECNKDGTYSCSIKMVGAGDILESLKINQSVNQSSFTPQKESTRIEVEIAGLDEDEKEGLSSLVGDRDLSLLNRALFDLNQYHVGLSFSEGIMINNTFDKGYRNILNKILSNCPYDFIQFDESGDFIRDNQIAIRGNHGSIINKSEKLENIPLLRRNLFNVFGVKYNINDNSPSVSIDSLQPQIYLTLGNLLSLVTATGMIYDSNKEGKGNPYVYIDFNDSLNFCSTFKGQLSLDPQVCIIPRNQSNLVDLFGVGIMEDKIFNKINLTTIGKTQKVYFNSKNESSSPIIENTLISEKTSDISQNSYLITDNNLVRANMMHILVNINYVTNVLRELRNKDEKGNVSLSDFLNQILSGMSKSLGNFNEFRLLVDDSSKSFKIVDDVKTLSYEEFNNIDNFTEIPVFGQNSIVYDYNFKSKISPKMASMVTIAAQAEPATLGEDSFAISNLSRGLTDRYMTYKNTSEPNPPTPANASKSKESLSSLKTHLSNILEGVNGEFIINQNLIESSYNTYKEILANFRLNEDSTNKGTVIIPLDFSISMDGISGIIPNSAFTIPTNLLPSSYLTKEGKSKIAFILHTITQNFDNNKWITKITGQTINIRFDKEDKKEYIDPPYTPNNQQINVDSNRYAISFSNTCTRRANALFEDKTKSVAIEELTKAAREVGLITPQSISSLISIAAGECRLVPQTEKHIYSESRIRQIFPYLSQSQYSRATKKGISKKDFFTIVYGEYYPSRVGNRSISDGGIFYGRGYIQLTGYGNYKRYADLSGIDIVKNPELVNDIVIGAKIAALYFKDRVKASIFDSNYMESALPAVGYNVGDIRQKKIEYYNCYKTKI